MIQSFKLSKNKSNKGNTIYVFVDASNLWEAQKAKGRLLDWGKTVNYLKDRFDGTSIKVFYYSSYPADGTRSYSIDGRHKFFTFLKKGLGFEVRKKQLKRISIIEGGKESVKEKGDMDVEITVDAMHQFEKYDTAIFFTGDSDFLVLVSYLRNGGKRVYIFSSQNNISQELRTGGDGYFDILRLEEDIWRNELKHRMQKAK